MKLSRHSSAVMMAWSAVFLASAAAQQASTSGQTQDPTLPPTTQIQTLQLLGKGVQIYVCKQDPNAAPKWTFVAPEASLFDTAGAEAGTHGAGPHWTLKNGSSVHGKVTTEKPSPDSIPWLLLQAVNPTGPGALAEVTFIRRSETTGGKAPSTGCDVSHLGATARIPYTATYTFYAPAPAPH